VSSTPTKTLIMKASMGMVLLPGKVFLPGEREPCLPRVRVFRRKVPGTGYQVPGTWHLGPDTWYQIDAEGRTPSTEDRARALENAHTGYAFFSTPPKTRTRGMQVTTPGVLIIPEQQESIPHRAMDCQTYVCCRYMP